MGKHAAPRRRRQSSSSARGLVRLISFVACGSVVAAVLAPAIASHSPSSTSVPADSLGGAGISNEPTDSADRSTAPLSRDAYRMAEASALDAAPEPELLIPKAYQEYAPRLLSSPDFKVSSFNLLGHSHTIKGGNKPGYADGPTRARWAAQLLNAQGVSVVGVQEMQMPQYSAFMNYTGNSWGAYPGPAGGRGAVQNSVMWRKSTWRLIKSDSSPIPYFGGRRIAMPHVLLEHIATGRRVWFGNYHNPADVHGGAQHWRDIATSMEANLADQLMQDTGYPVIMTGDMNDRERFACPFTNNSDPMHSADGVHSDESGCHTASSLAVDWIMGSAQITFSGYLENRSALVTRTSDHPMIVATVSLDPSILTKQCVNDASTRLCPPAAP